MRLRTLDGRLWYGDRLRLESEALVLVDGGRRFDWDGAWQLTLATRPARLGMPEAGAKREALPFLAIRADGEVHRVETEWDDCWEVLQALAEYLATTPTARAGLDDPARADVLVRELSAGRWRKPYPAAPPLMGDGLDLHNVVVRALRRHARYLGERTVRGEPLPPVERIVAEAARALPAWVRRRDDTAWIEATVERHLQTGQWPFDALLPDGAKISA